MKCDNCGSNFRTLNCPIDEDRICYKCQFNNGKEKDEKKLEDLS